MFIAFSHLNSTNQLLVLGLSRVNRERLEDGKPIFLERKTHGMAIPAGLKICLFAGETEESMQDQMRELIGPTTVIDQLRPE